MESLDFDHGSRGLLISVIVMLGLNLFVWMCKFIYNVLRQRSAASIKSLNELKDKLQEAIIAMNGLQMRIKELEDELKGFHKLKDDMKRMKLVIKTIAKDQWNDIKELFYDDD